MNGYTLFIEDHSIDDVEQTMISEKQANSLMKRFIKLRNKANDGDQKAAIKLKLHMDKCMKQFAYVIHMHTDRYKAFCNYEDLIQEGYVGLVKAMNSYDPAKGSIFWWLHHYIRTRISRSANTHTAIRFPLKFAKANIPHKENNIPLLIETRPSPEQTLESIEISEVIGSALHKLDTFQRKIVVSIFGIETGCPQSINKVCQDFKISRKECITTLNNAIVVLKENIDI